MILGSERVNYQTETQFYLFVDFSNDFALNIKKLIIINDYWGKEKVPKPALEIQETWQNGVWQQNNNRKTISWKFLSLAVYSQSLWMIFMTLLISPRWS